MQGSLWEVMFSYKVYKEFVFLPEYRAVKDQSSNEKTMKEIKKKTRVVIFQNVLFSHSAGLMKICT